MTSPNISYGETTSVVCDYGDGFLTLDGEEMFPVTCDVNDVDEMVLTNVKSCRSKNFITLSNRRIN